MSAKAKRLCGELAVLLLALVLVGGLVFLEVKAIMGLFDLDQRARMPGLQETTQGGYPGDRDQARIEGARRMAVANALALTALVSSATVCLLWQRWRRSNEEEEGLGSGYEAVMIASGDTVLVPRRASTRQAGPRQATAVPPVDPVPPGDGSSF
jgi:hypothetical protein